MDVDTLGGPVGSGAGPIQPTSPDKQLTNNLYVSTGDFSQIQHSNERQ